MSGCSVLQTFFPWWKNITLGGRIDCFLSWCDGGASRLFKNERPQTGPIKFSQAAVTGDQGGIGDQSGGGDDGIW
jgi:hypothetical protein